MQSSRKMAYQSDTSEEEWSFVAPCLCLLPEDAAQRRHDLRAVFNALKWLLWTGAPWRALPHDFPPWSAVYQQAMRWLGAGVFEAMVHDLRLLLRDFAGRKRRPTAAVLDSRTLQSTPESRSRAGWDGAQRKKGSKLHAAVDTLGHLLALHVTPANEQDRAQVERLAAAVQEATGESVEIACVDQGYSGSEPAQAAARQSIRLILVKHLAAKRGFVLLPRRWAVERSFAWAARFRRLAKDYERLPSVLAGFHFLAFACLMVHKAVPLLASRP
ncbi:MAG: IS5 family transposase [Stellaceae bacterium]